MESETANVSKIVNKKDNKILNKDDDLKDNLQDINNNNNNVQKNKNDIETNPIINPNPNQNLINTQINNISPKYFNSTIKLTPHNNN